MPMTYSTGLESDDLDDDPPLTAAHMIEQLGFGCYQIRVVIVMGFLAATEAIEILLLAVLGPALQCQWLLTPFITALLSICTIAGLGLGGYVFGTLADHYGRRSALQIANAVTIYFSILTAFSPSMIWIVILRGLTGIGIGGVISVTYILYTELTPMATRAKGMVALVSCWAIGTCLACLVAWLTLEKFGWRYMLIFFALPGPLSGILIYTCLPESPQILVLQGQAAQALAVINNIAKSNKKMEFKQEPVLFSTSGSANINTCGIFHPNYLRTTLLLFLIWFSEGFNQYGNYMLAATLPTQIDIQCKNKISVFEDKSCCHPITGLSYQAMSISAIGELGGYPVAVILSDTLGRLWSIRICSFLAGVSFLSLGVFCPPWALLLDTLFLLNRTFTLAVLYTIVIYTTEIYPTFTRSTGLGVCQIAARIGSLMTPLAAQLLLPYTSILITLLIYSLVALISVCAAFFLRIETKGRVLEDTINKLEENSEPDTDNTNDKIVGTDYKTFK